MKKIFTLLFVALMGMSFSMKAQEAEPASPDAIYPAFTAEDEEWTPNYLVEEAVQVEAYEGYFIIKGWSGVDGYDIKIAYDADENVTGLTTIANGVEGKTVTKGYSDYIKTGLSGEGDITSACFYVGTGYSYAINSDDEGGYALLTMYANNEFLYYYLWWYQSYEQINDAAWDDTLKLLEYQEYTEPTWDFPQEYSEKALAAAAELDELIFTYFYYVEEAADEAMGETGEYISPLTEEAIAELDAALAEFNRLSGIMGIATDGAAARYYDLNGVEVANPAAGKIYIRVAGGKATKTLVK